MKNLPVAVANNPKTATDVKRALQTLDTEGILAIPGFSAPDYGKVKNLAGILAEGFGEKTVRICLEQDMAKALGHALQLRLPPDRPCLCMDGLALDPGSYLDVGAPIGPALPVVIKSLIFGGNP